MRTICFCNSNVPWGGGEYWHWQAAKSLAARGWRVLVLCRPDGELYARLRSEPSVTVVPMRIGRLSFLNPLAHARLIRFFRKEQVHSVIMNLPADLKAVGPAAQSAGVKHIVYRRGSAIPVRDTALNRRLYGSVLTGLIVNSKATGECVLANNPALIAPEKMHTIPNGVDIAAFDAALARAQALRECAPAAGEPKPFVLGNAGRLNRQKAQHLVLHLGAQLKARGVACRIVIAGQGEREGELRALADSLGIAAQTTFTGFMEDLSPFWLSIDLFVLTSLWEGFGNVILEAGLAEKPVFAFGVSNIPEIVQEGVNGRLFPMPENAESYSGAAASDHSSEAGANAHTPNALSQMPDTLSLMADAATELAAHPEKGVAMGKNGRRMAEAYGQEYCMDMLESLLK